MFRFLNKIYYNKKNVNFILIIICLLLFLVFQILSFDSNLINKNQNNHKDILRQTKKPIVLDETYTYNVTESNIRDINFSIDSRQEYQRHLKYVKYEYNGDTIKIRYLIERGYWTDTYFTGDNRKIDLWLMKKKDWDNISSKKFWVGSFYLGPNNPYEEQWISIQRASSHYNIKASTFIENEPSKDISYMFEDEEYFYPIIRFVHSGNSWGSEIKLPFISLKHNDRIIDFADPSFEESNITDISSTTAKVDYKLSLPSSSAHKPATIKSIKVFNNGKEIASSPNTNLSGEIQIDGLTSGEDYQFELRVDSNAGLVKKDLDKFTTPLASAELPIINSVNAIPLSSTTAKVDYKLSLPSSPAYEPTTIKSIKVFNNGKEIASSPNTNLSGTIQINKLTPGKDYTFELKVDSNAGLVKKNSNKITLLESAELPIINSVNATPLSSTTAKVDYKLSLPSSPAHKPTTIKSIKAFNNGKEIASAPNTNSSGTIQINKLTPGKDYTFELRVDSNAGLVKKNSNKITLLDSAELPIINSVNATPLSSTTAKVDYKLSLPSSPTHEPTIIKSIKVFNNGKEIASSPNTNLSGTIQINKLAIGKDYTFELRVDSNAGLVKKNSNKITTLDSAELPIINSVNATVLSSTTAKLNYQLSFPSSPTHKPTTIKSIKVFNNGKEIASAPNTNSSGVIQINKLTSGKDYTFELRVDSNAGLVKKNSNKIAIPLAGVELPTINSVNATAISSTTAKVDYKLSIPSSPTHKPTKINSIKLYSHKGQDSTWKEIASVPNTNLLGSIKIGFLNVGEDYTFELRVDSNAGLVKKKTKTLIMHMDNIQIFDKNILISNKIVDGKYCGFVNLKSNRKIDDNIEKVILEAKNSKGKNSIIDTKLISNLRSNNDYEYSYSISLNEGEMYYNPSLKIILYNNNTIIGTELEDEFNYEKIFNGKIYYFSNNSSHHLNFGNKKTITLIFALIAPILFFIILIIVIIRKRNLNKVKF